MTERRRNKLLTNTLIEAKEREKKEEGRNQFTSVKQQNKKKERGKKEWERETFLLR
jgi:hypothetical protein